MKRVFPLKKEDYFLMSKSRLNGNLYGDVHLSYDGLNTLCGIKPISKENWWLIQPDSRLVCKNCLKQLEEKI
jgi:hypothetical protein